MERLLDISPNRSSVIWGDCEDWLKHIPPSTANCIYIDPPFFSQRNYEIIWGNGHEKRCFTDRWKGGKEHYLAWMRTKLREAKRILYPDGSLFLHCDFRANYRLRMLLDDIFGEKNFVNEIIWCYSQGGKSKRRFGRKHDTIFWYVKDKQNYKFYPENIKIPFTPHKQSKSGKNFGGQMGIEKGRAFVLKWGKGKKKQYKYYIDEGKTPEDWWTDINSLQSGSKERIGYNTQKPEALIKRIIMATTQPKGMVVDFFGGGEVQPL